MEKIFVAIVFACVFCPNMFWSRNELQKWFLKMEEE